MGLTKPRAAQIFNLDYKQATRVVTTTNITLTGGAPSLVDGVSLSLGDRVLVTAQTTGTQNGLYYVTTVGSGADGTWARTSDGNENGEIEAGMIVMVTEGVIYADTQWKLITDEPITIGTTALTFTQNYMANSISSGTSNVVINSNANVTVSSAGTANVLTISSTGTVTSGTASVTGNITGGNIVTVGAVSTTGNAYVGNILTNGYYYANGVAFSGGGGGGGTPGGANTQIQFNDGGAFGGTAGLTFNKTTNAIGATGAFSTTGTVTAASVVGGVITGTSLSVSGAVTGASVVGGVMTGSSVSVTGTVTGASLAGTITTASQTNITSVGTLGSLSVTANVQGGNLRTAGLVSATGSITAGGDLSLVGNIVDTGPLTVSTSSNGNITLAPNGTGVVIVNTDIRNGQVSGTGNIGATGAVFNTIFAKATSAQYADLAEMYVADNFYTPGTVVEFGGNNEITATTTTHSTQVAGIISTNPAYLMNSTQAGEHAVEVALVGRVPCSVVGTVRKGDRLVSSDRPGIAQALNTNLYQPGCIVGKALEEYNSTNPGVIEVAVGRS
jgi:hypothetical protein